jgi:UMF1 family MFS transporter
MAAGKNWLEKLGLHRRELRAWAMYDWANSSYATTVVAAVLPIYFHDVAAADLPEHLRSAYWGYVSGLALLLVAVMSPLVGAVADYLGAKKRLLFALTVVGAASAAATMFVYRGDWLLAAALFVVGNVAFFGGYVFYDSLLPHIAAPDEVDRVSSAGFALGYLGGGLLLALNLAWIMQPQLFGMADKGVAVRMSFLSVGIWWLVFSIPLMRQVSEPPATRADGDAARYLRAGLARLRTTFGQVRRFKQTWLFLLAFWCYSDGIGTIFKMAAVYGREIGIEANGLIGALLLAQFLGIPATFAFGAFASRIGAKAAIMATLAVYTGICVLGFYMTTAWQFWVLAGLVAVVQGGAQALSRSLFSQIVPKSKSAEFFSFYSVSSRFAGVIGPLLFGVVAQVAGGSRLSILMLIALFAAGMAILSKVNVEEAKRVARDAEDELRRPSFG